MSTVYELSGGLLRVTKWWANGSFRWTLHADTIDAYQIAELFDLLDPVVGAALLEAVREEKEKRG